MDTKKIGQFLKELRKEKGLTQEQFAEILLVSGRTVSRWETGTNMPDLSILIQIAEFYDVELTDILDGERRSGIMDKKLKESLTKAADYSELEKEKAARSGSTAFGVMFAVCAVMILVQMVITGNLSAIAGETVTLLIGGAVYIGIMLHNGIWQTGSRFKSTPSKDALVSVVCSGVFSVVFGLYLIQSGADTSQVMRIVLVFFAGITVLCFAVLRILAFFNSKRKGRENFSETSGMARDVPPVKIFTAEGNMQADMVIEALKNNGIPAYKQDMGDAGFASVRYGMGRGLNDSTAIFVAGESVGDALKVIHEIGLN